MMMANKIILVAKTALILASLIKPVFAGIPVFDGSNLSQNTMSALENVMQTIKQVEQYSTQLQQYETQLQQYQNMIQNTAQPATSIWNQATSTMNKLRGLTDTLSYYKNQLGSIDAYTSNFKDTAAYRNSPCFSVNGCTPAEWQAMKNTAWLGSASQKSANDAVFRGLDQQQNSLEADAQKLEDLQNSAQGATGQMQALGYANQLASAQTNQLMQIRGLMIAEQNAMTARNATLADKEAQQAAAHEASTRSIISDTRPTNNKKW